MRRYTDGGLRRGATSGRFALLLAALCAFAPASAQGWTPQRTVEIMVPNAQGSSLDTSARVVQRVMQDLKLVPTPIVLINRAGGEQSVGYTYLRGRAGDAHYIGFANPALLGNHISGRMPFTYTDFTPVAFLLTDDYVFAVRTDHPLKTGADLVDALKKRPDSLTFAIGNTSHRIAIGMVLQSANIDIRQVKLVVLQQGTQATSVLGGHVDVAVTPLAQLLPHIESGRLRVLAVSAPKRKPGVLANVATWPELGYKQGTYETWRAIIAPRDITAAQTAYWEDVMRKVVQSEDFRKAAEKYQWEISFKGAAEARRHMDEEYAATRSVMKYLGLVSE